VEGAAGPDRATAVDRPRLAVVIPARDEAATVGDIVRRARRHSDLVIVIDDGSADATAAVAEASGACVLLLSPNRGKGRALAAGLAAARARGATVLVTLDADGEHEPEEIPKLVARLRDADVALGCRDAYRSVVRRGLNAVALFWFRLLDPSIRDTICGFRAFRADVAPVLESDAGGFVYEHDVLLRAIAGRLRLVSVPITTRPRTRTHVSARDTWRAAAHFGGWVLPRLGDLPIPGWRKALLALGCGVAVALSGRAAGIDAIGSRRDH
jgi:glycosyltransferase involved in cell wall biosynthesis